MATDKNSTTSKPDNQPSEDKKKGFQEGLADNSTTAGQSKTDKERNNPSSQTMNKQSDAKEKERREDTTALHDDEDVESK